MRFQGQPQIGAEAVVAPGRVTRMLTDPLRTPDRMCAVQFPIYSGDLFDANAVGA